MLASAPMKSVWLGMGIAALLACAGCDDDDGANDASATRDAATADGGGSAKDAGADGGLSTRPADGGADAAASTDPGALIAVSMSSTVGVLLDEIPEAVRDDAAARVLAQDE